MRVTVDVDCTPEEARRFLGLPDLTPLHDAYVERMKTAMGDQSGTEALQELMRSWGPMNEAGLGIWRQMMDQMGRKSST